MSPVLVCFGVLDAAVIAQAAYAVKELRPGESKPKGRDSQKGTDGTPRCEPGQRVTAVCGGSDPDFIRMRD